MPVNLLRKKCLIWFTDDATALSAVRNLQGIPVNGRNLRVEASTDEPGHRTRGGPGGGRGGRGGERSPQREYLPRGSGGAGYRPPPPPDRVNDDGYGAAPLGGAGRIDLNAIPSGIEIGGQNALDAISKTLAAVPRGEMQEVMASMKVSCHFRLEIYVVLLIRKPCADTDYNST